MMRSPPTRRDKQRGKGCEGLRALSARQDAAAARGIQFTYSQSRIGREMGLTRARVEQLELVAKLRFLKDLAQRCPQAFIELGGTYAQMAFLASAKVSAGRARRLWRRWCELGP